MWGTPELAATRIKVIGLGCVGLPLAVEFAKCCPTIGLDVRHARADVLRASYDCTLQVAATCGVPNERLSIRDSNP